MDATRLRKWPGSGAHPALLGQPGEGLVDDRGGLQGVGGPLVAEEAPRKGLQLMIDKPRRRTSPSR